MEEARAQQQVNINFRFFTDFIFQPANLLDLASDLLNRITARRSLNVYRIANSRGAVGSFSISKSSYKLGEDIVASFDFRFVRVEGLRVIILGHLVRALFRVCKYPCVYKQKNKLRTNTNVDWCITT